MNVGNLISDSSAFSKSSLYIWKFSVHTLLKLSLEDFEHDLASMWNAVCHGQKPDHVWETAVATGLEKVNFHSKPKECSNYHTTALISHASKIMLKILQARLQLFVNQELSDVQAEFWKGRGTGDQIANIH